LRAQRGNPALRNKTGPILSSASDDGCFLYYPSLRQNLPAFKVIVDALPIPRSIGIVFPALRSREIYSHDVSLCVFSISGLTVASPAIQMISIPENLRQ